MDTRFLCKTYCPHCRRMFMGRFDAVLCPDCKEEEKQRKLREKERRARMARASRRQSAFHPFFGDYVMPDAETKVVWRGRRGY